MLEKPKKKGDKGGFQLTTVIPFVPDADAKM